MKLNKVTFTAMAVLALVAQPLFAVAASQTASAAGGIVTNVNKDGWDFGGAAWPAGVPGSATIKAETGTGGNGALYLSTPANESYIWTVKETNESLAGINALTYKSKRVAGPAYTAPALLLGIDADGNPATTADSFYAFFEPVYNYSTASTNYDNWNTWNIDAATSKFWSFDVVGSKGGANGANMFTLDYVKSVYPAASVVQYYLNMGTGNTGWQAWTDQITVNGAMIADFELEEVVTNVTTGAVYEDLQSAVDAASAGDTLRLNQNITLADDVDITKSLTIDGNGKTITASFIKMGNDNNSALSVLASDVTIKNVVLDGVNPAVNQLHGINAYMVTNLTVDGVTAKNFRTGILYNGSTGTIQNVHTIHNIWHGINIDKAGANVQVLGTNTHTEDFNIYVDDDTVGVTVYAPAYEWSRSGLKGRDNDRVYRLKPVVDDTDDTETDTPTDNGAASGNQGEVPTNSATGGSGAVSDEPIVAVADDTTSEATDTKKAAEVLGDDQTKDTLSAQDSKKEWSLVNLLLAAVATVMSVVTLAGIRGSQGKQRNLRLLTLVPAVVAIVALLTVEDFTAGLGWVNGWTLLFAAIAIAQVALAASVKPADNE